MNESPTGDLAERVLVLAPTGRDARLIETALARARMNVLRCPTMEAVCGELATGAGALVIAEEALTSKGRNRLAATLADQPAWSDVPIVVLATPGEPTRASISRNGPLEDRGQIVLIERPTRTRTLVSAVASILRARRRQYELRELLEQREKWLAREARARAHAERANALKDELLATISHELRTPLNAIYGWTRMLRTGTLSDEKRNRALEVVERNAAAQVQLIEDLLDVSRIAVGTLRLDLAPVKLGPIVAAAVESCKPAIDAKRLNLVTLLDAVAVAAEVSGDAARLHQIVANLLSNAIKFTPPAGRIEIRLRATETTVELTVEDDGEGIEPEFLPYLFDTFRQADSSVRREHGGLGLGLAIVRELVEQHRGEIVATSDGKGRGSTFVVRFPRIRGVAVAGSTGGAEPVGLPADIGGLRVLVVDCDADARDLVAAVLERGGANVAKAGSAKEAFDAIARELPDAIFADVATPYEDSYAFIRRLRALPPEHGGNIPAAALMAYARIEDRRRAIREGYQLHVPKPLDPVCIVEATAQLVQLRRW